VQKFHFEMDTTACARVAHTHCTCSVAVARCAREHSLESVFAAAYIGLQRRYPVISSSVPASRYAGVIAFVFGVPAAGYIVPRFQ